MTEREEDTLIVDFLDAMATVWEVVRSSDDGAMRVFAFFGISRTKIPNPQPWQRPPHFREGCCAEQFIWLN